MVPGRSAPDKAECITGQGNDLQEGHGPDKLTNWLTTGFWHAREKRLYRLFPADFPEDEPDDLNYFTAKGMGLERGKAYREAASMAG